MILRVLRVAILLPSLEVGGAERLVIEELTYFKSDPRFSFELNLVFDKGPLFDMAQSTGIPIRVWKAPHHSIKMFRNYLDIVRHLRKNGFDIFHSHLLNGIGPIVGKLAGVKVVHTVHSDVVYGWWEQFVMRQSDLVLACGDKVLRNIQNFIPPEKVVVLKNGIDPPGNITYDRKRVLEKYGIKNNSTFLLTLGRLNKKKGFDILIEAIHHIASNMKQVVLLIGGEGDERKRLEEMIEARRLHDHVKLPGLIKDPHEVIAICDVFVNSSRHEGLPITLIEAIAHGKPIVATDVGGNSEVVKDGVTGLLVPPNDPEKLAEAILKILKDQHFRESAGKAAYALFLNEYNIEKHCVALGQCYLQLLQQKKNS